MIFLLPILLIIAVIFGIDRLYFSHQTNEDKTHSSHVDQNSSALERQKQEYIKGLFEKR